MQCCGPGTWGHILRTTAPLTTQEIQDGVHCFLWGRNDIIIIIIIIMRVLGLGAVEVGFLRAGMGGGQESEIWGSSQVLPLGSIFPG